MAESSEQVRTFNPDHFRSPPSSKSRTDELRSFAAEQYQADQTPGFRDIAYYLEKLRQQRYDITPGGAEALLSRRTALQACSPW